MKRGFSFGAIALFCFALPFAAVAKDNAARQEVATAHAHALMAASADSLKMTHAHLQHVINCLAGPKGAGFDASAADPCKGMGNGALSDAGSQTKLHSRLQDALETARSGTKSDSLKAAQKAAKKTASLLGNVSHTH